jgi:hypothetical protein
MMLLGGMFQSIKLAMMIATPIPVLIVRKIKYLSANRRIVLDVPAAIYNLVRATRDFKWTELDFLNHDEGRNTTCAKA